MSLGKFYERAPDNPELKLIIEAQKNTCKLNKGVNKNEQGAVIGFELTAS